MIFWLKQSEVRQLLQALDNTINQDMQVKWRGNQVYGPLQERIDRNQKLRDKLFLRIKP